LTADGDIADEMSDKLLIHDEDPDFVEEVLAHRTNDDMLKFISKQIQLEESSTLQSRRNQGRI